MSPEQASVAGWRHRDDAMHHLSAEKAQATTILVICFVHHPAQVAGFIDRRLPFPRFVDQSHITWMILTAKEDRNPLPDLSPEHAAMASLLVRRPGTRRHFEMSINQVSHVAKDESTTTISYPASHGLTKANGSENANCVDDPTNGRAPMYSIQHASRRSGRKNII